MKTVRIYERARILGGEGGKSQEAEAAGELRRGIENAEVACGIPTLLHALGTWGNEASAI